MKNNPRSYPAMLVAAVIIVVTFIASTALPRLGIWLSDQAGVDANVFVSPHPWMFFFLLLFITVFLYRMLKSQERVQREQINLNKLFAHAVRSGHHADMQLLDEVESVKTELEKLKSLRFKVLKNDAFNVAISCDWKHSVSENYYLQKTPTGYESTIARLEKDVEFLVDITDKRFPDLSDFKQAQSHAEENAPHIECYRLKFHFTDAFGLQYSKVFILSYSPTEKKFHHISSGVEHQ